MNSESAESSEALSTTSCGHVLHHPWVLQWLSRSQECPQCKYYVSATSTQPINLKSLSDNSATTEDLMNKIVKLQKALDMKGTELSKSKLANKKLNDKLISTYRRMSERASERAIMGFIHDSEQSKLSSELKSKSDSEKNLLMILEQKQQEIRRLEDSAKADKEAYRLQTEKESQRDKLIKELTAKCSELESSQRSVAVCRLENASHVHSQPKLETELEKRNNEIAALQTANAVKEEPVENVADRNKDSPEPKRSRL